MSRIVRSCGRQPDALGRVQPGRGLVEQQHVRTPGERSGDRDELTLALRQFGDRTLRQRGRAGARSSTAAMSSLPAARLLACPTATFSSTVRSSYRSRPWKVRPSPSWARRCGGRVVDVTVADA